MALSKDVSNWSSKCNGHMLMYENKEKVDKQQQFRCTFIDISDHTAPIFPHIPPSP